MGPDHASDEGFASNAASDGDASSDREPPQKKTKRGRNKAKAALKPRKAAREALNVPALSTDMAGADGAFGDQSLIKSAEKTTIDNARTDGARVSQASVDASAKTRRDFNIGSAVDRVVTQDEYRQSRFEHLGRGAAGNYQRDHHSAEPLLRDLVGDKRTQCFTFDG
ncbi:hypothetical protein GN958_ATG14786 [Phytophthora infestans]|uniref:Uncharacterized protein n=1 Tax=Phytophthora infestans TaxID=4787 RepID=A0A8S9U662_PHYIN|nr:hypothetical protein GN958_ATG14786 [Phytophthora infestans]